MTESLRTLLNQLIDYAGLFPPAKLSMAESIGNFKSYRGGEYAWMLNRFVLPAARLIEFAGLFEQIGDAAEWELSAVIGADAETDIANAVEFNRHISKGGARSVVRSVELKVGDAQSIGRLRPLIPESMEAFFELSVAQKDFDECISELAETESYAKLRTGGETPEMIPNCADVAHFLAACSFAAVPLKCTAGLHFPLRGACPLGTQPGAPEVKMHGFLNVFAAAALAQAGATEKDLEALLTEESVSELQFEPGGFRWQGHVVRDAQLAAARSTFCLSFGSCSFTEPLDGLRALGLL